MTPRSTSPGTGARGGLLAVAASALFLSGCVAGPSASPTATATVTTTVTVTATAPPSPPTLPPDTDQTAPPQSGDRVISSALRQDWGVPATGSPWRIDHQVQPPIA